MPNSILCQESKTPAKSGLEKVGFGGGCHWCTEAVFNALRGVANVEQGFIKSRPPSDAYSEAVQLTFNPEAIPLAALVEVHLRTHASTSNHSLRTKYRSAVYVFNDIQAANVRNILHALQADFSSKLITQVLPFVQFKPSNKRYHQYYANNASGEFCTRYIDPKLDMLKTQYSGLLTVSS